MRFSFFPLIVSVRSAFNTAVTEARKNARTFLALGLLLFGGAEMVRAQSALDGFDPNANFFVRVVVAQPDGKILVGGEFTSFSPNSGGAVPRNHMARLNPDGSLDTTFDPNVDPNAFGGVSVIVVQPDGKILIGGDFTTLAPNGGAPVTRNRIARLNPDGSLDTAFNPNASAPVGAIAVQADGKILAGGSFTSIDGQTRIGIARLDPVTGAADSFNPNASGGFPPTTVNTIVAQPDGRILVGGNFLNIGGQVRNRIARLDPVTGAADSFNPSPDGFTGVQEMIVQPDGKILVGGSFLNVGGQPRNNIARLDPVTGAADSWNPNANNTVHAMALQPDGKVLIGGDFNIVGGVTTFMARLDPVTGAPDAFNPGSNERVFSIALQSDGKILAGGGFSTMGGQPRNCIARLGADGRLDRTLNLNLGGNPLDQNAVYATAVQSDGKILIGGLFTTVLGVTRNNIARLNTDGTLDTAFNPNATGSPLGTVYSIAVQANGEILVGGSFTTIGGQPRNRIARLNAEGSLDPAFNPNASGLVRVVVVQPDGKILLGGDFTTLSPNGGAAVTRNRIARLNPDGSLDTAFNPNASGVVISIAVQADGKILAGGAFNGGNSIGGQVRNYIARLDAMTGLADSFDPNATNTVFAIAVQADGKIIVGGDFGNIGGQPRVGIARLEVATGLADSFDPHATNGVYTIAVQADGKILAGGAFNGTNSIGGQLRNRIARLDAATGFADSFDPNAGAVVFSVAVQADGKILAGGTFSGANGIGGQPRSRFARLSNDTAAVQNLAVSQTVVTWIRAGSSPQFARVAFESSTDNLNYTPLGNGTASGSNWTLSGLNLPSGQNLYIRARGHYSGGYASGSESIQESLRNAFLTAAPLQLTTAVSRKTHGGAGTFDIPLPLTGEPAVECRSSGGAHTLVFTFSNNVVSGNASVTTGTGSVSGSPAFAGNLMTVNLTGVTDVQKLTVTLSNVTDTFAQVLPNTAVSMNVLAGDTNGNKIVNGSDVAQTKSQSGVPVTAANFKQDVAVNGAINGSDVALVKSRSGQFVP